MADSLDVLTEPEARAALRKGSLDAKNAADLERLVTVVSRRLDKLVGPIVRRPITAERHDGGTGAVVLEWGPVASVSTVTEYQGTTAVNLVEQTPGVEPTDGWYGERYDPDPSLYSGIIVRTLGGYDSCFWAGRGNVVVTYTAGRVTATSTVDERHKEAAVLMLRNLWRPYENAVGVVGEFDTPMQNYPTFAVPNAVRDLLAEEIIEDVGLG